MVVHLQCNPNSQNGTKIVLSLNLCYHGLRPPSEKRWPDGCYDLNQKLQELIGSQLLSGENLLPLFEVRSTSRQLRTSIFELRGDWKWFKELFAMSCGWNSDKLCYLCHCRKESYLRFPSLLREQPRRTPEEFAAVLKVDSSGSKSSLT